VNAPPTTSFEVTITEAQVEQFRRDGFTSVPRITTDEEVEWMRGVFDDLFAERRGGFPGGYFDLARPYDSEGDDHLPQVLMPELEAPGLHHTAFHRNAKAIAARLLSTPEADLHAWSHMIFKPAGHGHETPWHQDEAYWEPHSDYHAVGAWTPLDDADLENGCMCFIPGSHLTDVRAHRHIGDDPAVHGLVTDDVDPSTMVAVPLSAGGATFHHPRMLHHTPANRSDRPRRAYATEFQTTPVRREVVAERPWVDDQKAAWDARSVYRADSAR
jgi:ectoine hydroxylase-related dioxygenase (phytanoyl-CoA dioxygenase family)